MRFFSRLAVLALVALPLAAGVAGCDGVDVVEQTTGPVVQFGTPSVNAVEGTSVSIPVRLTGSNGQPVTVEVLFAAGASVSTATYGADFANFGQTRDGFQVATVTFAGTADETVDVTFDVVQDNAIESSETAVFVLQQASNATIGSVRELTVNIGVPPISAIRALAPTPTGSPDTVLVTVEGIVTRALGRQVFLQDASAGIVLFGPESSALGAAVASGVVRVGDRLQATGRLIEFQPTAGVPGTGLTEVDFINNRFEVLSRDNALPAAQTITLAQFTAGDPDSDTWESEIVRVENLTVDPAGDIVFVASRNYTVSQTVGGVTTTAILRITSASDTQLDGTPIPTGTFTFQGPAGQFRGTNQLSPILVPDLAP